MSVQLAQKADLMQKFNMRPGVQTKMNTVSNAPKLSSSATNVSTATSSKVGGESSLSSRAASGMALKGDAAPISFNRYANNAYVHSPRVDAKPFMDRNTAIARNSFNRQPNVEFAFGKYSSDPTGTPLRPSDYTKMLNQYNAMYMAQNPYGMLNQMQTNNNPMDLASVAKMSFDIGKNIIGLVKDIKASNTESPKESDIAKLNANTASMISSADSSADLVEARAEIKEDIEQNKIEQNKLSEDIGEDTKLRDDAKGQLDTVSGNISSLTREISALKVSGMKDGVDNSAQIKEKEAKLAELKKQQQELEATIKNLDKSISENEKQLESKQEQAKALEAQHTKAQAKEDKLEKKEAKELNKISSKLDDLKAKIEKEEDKGKKQELIAKYNAQVNEFNGVLKGANSDVTSQFQAMSQYEG